MRAATLAVVALVALAVCALARAEPFELQPGTRVLAPIQYQQLAVFPVVRSAAPTVDKLKFLTLSDGLRSRLVTVREDGAGGTVNRVHVQNRAERPLLLLGGEVILGGQQDRILGKDTVVPPHEEMALEVFCVEHGRWNGAREFTQAHGMADGKIRLRAKYQSNQQGVWDAVAEKNAHLSAAPATGTYRNLAAGAEGERAKKPYRDRLVAALDRLPERAQLVGLVAAVNGRVTSVELFAEPSLFAAYRDKLLDSIVMSAVDVVPAPAARPAAAADIRAFVQRAEAAPPTEVAKTKAGRTVEKKDRAVLESTVEVDHAPIYKSYQANE